MTPHHTHFRIRGYSKRLLVDPKLNANVNGVENKTASRLLASRSAVND